MKQQQQATQPNAKIIADSISTWGQRLTTLEVVMHRFVLAEFNTHRVFSRNSASSRAIPYHKVRNRVVNDPAFPVKWASEKPGMQGGDELKAEYLSLSKRQWELAKENAVTHADFTNEFGLHKSLVNRLLEPFMWHTVIVTATEWDNFFWQRCRSQAQPEMKAAADSMQFAYYTSTPKPMAHGQWHLPYISDEDIVNVKSAYPGSQDMHIVALLKRISVARCARVSYLTHDGIRDFNVDLGLFDKLETAGHWSPFEHVATPIAPGIVGGGEGNFVGWRQYRKSYASENHRNFVPNLPELRYLTEGH